MITVADLNPHKYPTDAEIDENLKILCERVNVMGLWWGRPLVVTSGLRSRAQQDALIAAGKSKAKKSKHLIGAACDLADADGSLKTWVGENLELMADLGLWAEDFASTPTWCHIQILPPASGARVFKP